MEFKVKSIEPVGRDEGFRVTLETTPAGAPFGGAPFVVGEVVEIVELPPVLAPAAVADAAPELERTLDLTEPRAEAPGGELEAPLAEEPTRRRRKARP